jgi:hypothetical protein
MVKMSSANDVYIFYFLFLWEKQSEKSPSIYEKG